MKRGGCEPERPPCACGAPATHEVEISVKPLELDRDAGPRTTAYWRPNFRPITHLSQLMCSGCVKRCVRVDMTCTATIEKAARKGPE